MITFDQSNFSASPRIFPRIKIIFKNAKRKKKRKKRESFDRQRGLMEAYPSRYDRSFNFLSGSGANISPPLPRLRRRGDILWGQCEERNENPYKVPTLVPTVFKVFLESSTGNGAFIRKYSISLYLRFTLSLAPFNPQQDSSISLRPISPLDGPPLSASFCHS